MLLLSAAVHVTVGMTCPDTECDVSGYCLDGMLTSSKDSRFGDEETDVAAVCVAKFEYPCCAHELTPWTAADCGEWAKLSHDRWLKSIHTCWLLHREGVSVKLCMSVGSWLSVTSGDNTIIDYSLLLNVTSVISVVGEHSVWTGSLEEDPNLHVIYCGDYSIV